MTRQQVRASVAEYRRRATLARQFRARRQALRGQRGSSTGLQHSLAMADILGDLRDAGHVKLSDALKAWNAHLGDTARASTPEQVMASRAAARKLTTEINQIIDAIPVEWSGRRVR